MGEKRKYTMSERALEQRQRAAELSTGPKTADGKARSSRNAWKTGEYSALQRLQLQNTSVGLFAKPCRTTCPKHPDQNPEFPCSLVMDGLTSEGGDCLDKSVYVDAFTAVIDAVQHGEYDGVNGMAAGHLAGGLDVLHRAREELAEHGLLIDQPIVNKDGDVIGYKTVANPVLQHYNNLLKTLGINLAEMMATPKARQKLIDPDDPDDPVAGLFGALARLGGNNGGNRPEIIDDADFSEVDDGA